MKKKAYHHGNLRQALIEAAVELVEEVGPHGFTMREAARRAGVSSGAPYKHFKDQKELMCAVAAEGARKRQELMDRAMEEAGDDPLARFRAMGVTYVTFAAANPGYFRVLNSAEYNTPESSPELQRAHEEGNAQVRALLERGQREGSVGGADPDAIFLAAQCLVHGLACQIVDGTMALAGHGPEEAERLALIVTDVLGRGLGALGDTDEDKTD